MGNDENLILRLTFEFALEIVKYSEVLESQRKYNMANQLFRAGTSIGAHVEEAQGPESRADFIHKMKGGYKEACESLFWLRVSAASPSYPDPGDLPQKATIIIKVIGKIISSSRNNGRRPDKD